jgi:hypothetical protein
MKIATLVFVLAQIAPPSPDVTIKLQADTAKYCIGSTGPSVGQARGPDDILLQLPLKVRYINHRTEQVFLSDAVQFQMDVMLPGKNDPIIGRRGGGGTRDVSSPYFGMIELEKAEPNKLDLTLTMTCSVKDPGCFQAYIYIPVLDRSASLDLRGKTVEIVTTRDHSLAPDMVQKFKEKVKDRGTVFAGVVKSEPFTFRIPDDPSARDCRVTQ